MGVLENEKMGVTVHIFYRTLIIFPNLSIFAMGTYNSDF